jgi:hypothetical protein
MYLLDKTGVAGVPGEAFLRIHKAVSSSGFVLQRPMKILSRPVAASNN